MAASRRPVHRGKARIRIFDQQTAEEPIQLFVLLERATRQLRARPQLTRDMYRGRQNLVVVERFHDVERRSGALASGLSKKVDQEAAVEVDHRRIARARVLARARTWCSMASSAPPLIRRLRASSRKRPAVGWLPKCALMTWKTTGRPAFAATAGCRPRCRW